MSASSDLFCCIFWHSPRKKSDFEKSRSPIATRPRVMLKVKSMLLWTRADWLWKNEREDDLNNNRSALIIFLVSLRTRYRYSTSRKCRVTRLMKRRKPNKKGRRLCAKKRQNCGREWRPSKFKLCRKEDQDVFLFIVWDFVRVVKVTGTNNYN